jgi:serine/threonine-protein kinase ULK/ATG1
MGPDSESETSREQEIKTRKRNANRLLHERNIYVFLASVAEDAMNNATILKNAEFVGFLLVKKLVQTVEGMLYKLSQKNNLFNLEMWNQFLDTKDFKDIFSYIEKEYDVFKMYYQSMYDKLASGGKIKSISGD